MDMDPTAILEMVMGKKGRPANMQHAQAPQQAAADIPQEALAMLMGQTDPNNTNPNAQPLGAEDGENGYWDAQNMGNGKGNSFLMENGQQRAADPVGNGALVEEILAMVGNANGKPLPGESRMNDPAFADAYQEWTDENGREPATDGEFAEVEQWAAMMTNPGPSQGAKRP